MGGTGGYDNPAGAHLMICLAAPTPEGNAIIVPVVSRHAYSDDACVLMPDDHPFVRHESCAAYDFTRSISMAAINADIASGAIKLRQPVSTDVLVRLQIGFVTSDETAPWIFNEARGSALVAHLKIKGFL